MALVGMRPNLPVHFGEGVRTFTLFWPISTKHSRFVARLPLIAHQRGRPMRTGLWAPVNNRNSNKQSKNTRIVILINNSS